ncbi:MAG: flagellar FliJ family protein [Alphaproteobacteria bacterium]|nr:flagellar FliJ family protein [Alphaproteobacteria bacterium]
MGKDLNALIRYTKWGVDEKRRVMADLQRREDEIIAQQRQLEEEIVAEQRLVVKAETEIGFAYGAYAIRCIQRRADLVRALENAHVLVEQAQEELAEAYRELKTYEITQANRERRERQEQERLDQVATDEISQNLFRRSQAEEAERHG